MLLCTAFVISCENKISTTKPENTDDDSVSQSDSQDSGNSMDSSKPNEDYPAPYGYIDVNVNSNYIITNEQQLDSSMANYSYFATGTFGTSGNLQPAGAEGVVYHTSLDGNRIGILQIPFADNGQTLLNPIVSIQMSSNISAGTVSVGLTPDDDAKMLVMDTDASGLNILCYHGFVVGQMTITDIDLTPGANGVLAITGSKLELYSSENAPMSGGNINITSQLNSDDKPWIPCTAQ